MNLELMCQKASECKLIVGKMDTDDKNKVLMDAADLLVQNADKILSENAKDIENAATKGMEKGIEQGIEQNIKKTIKNLLEAGMDLEFISKITGKQVDEIEKIKDTLV